MSNKSAGRATMGRLLIREPINIFFLQIDRSLEFALDPNHFLGGIGLNKVLCLCNFQNS